MPISKLCERRSRASICDGTSLRRSGLRATLEGSPVQSAPGAQVTVGIVRRIKIVASKAKDGSGRKPSRGQASRMPPFSKGLSGFFAQADGEDMSERQVKSQAPSHCHSTMIAG